MSKSFWDMSVEEVMGINTPIDNCATPVRDSDSPSGYSDDTYYSRSNIAQLSIHEPSAEELISKYSPVNPKGAIQCK